MLCHIALREIWHGEGDTLQCLMLEKLLGDLGPARGCCPSGRLGYSAGWPTTFEFQIKKNTSLVLVCSKYCMRYTYSIIHFFKNCKIQI